ncbi:MULTISPECIES: nuclease-related domain-containing protein [Clostridium]|uniref:NERD domain-containing protein n=2 Tax=Clostridium TaxID=1485 RepID=D8GIF5_CLOLD|nr:MULTISPECIES: nuclease-related domain-containing protein [Clostridium]ADK17029.1 hypothetical protein CLJU_c40050 [Clostridium ljungdahlii DSM 13528]AGY76073.1 NERD domain-containing protein [Clostridium autoethanogenum DSM 10061]ALU36235.1 Hypothetical protein CLAU_1806 [Clostridium autoethanogenum DSM 10061]OAA85202.1 hypothetical protein WX45_00706 [Clostridium ljungdahlii DSM 13528]OVY48796.1 hypothetical protein WX72_00185 [Clostridium autoethanogenum]
MAIIKIIAMPTKSNSSFIPIIYLLYHLNKASIFSYGIKGEKKVGQKGGVYYKNFYNPCKQSRRHVYTLSCYLKENQLGHLWIQPIVVFTIRWSSRLKVPTNSTPVMKVNELLSFIDNFKSKNRTISHEEIKKLETIIDTKIDL